MTHTVYIGLTLRNCIYATLCMFGVATVHIKINHNFICWIHTASHRATYRRSSKKTFEMKLQTDSYLFFIYILIFILFNSSNFIKEHEGLKGHIPIFA